MRKNTLIGTAAAGFVHTEAIGNGIDQWQRRSFSDLEAHVDASPLRG